MCKRFFRFLMLLTAVIALTGCGGGGSSASRTTQSVDPGTGTGDVTVTGKVSGTAFVAVDAASATVVARHVATVQSDGSKVFSIKIQSGKQYKFYLVENEGTSDERVFPLYIGSGNKVSVAAGTCDLGFVTTTDNGTATPAVIPAQFTEAVEDKTIPAGVAANSSSVYTQADLTGTWYFFQFISGTNPYWARATYIIDANGTATPSNGLNSHGGTDQTSTKSMNITPSGFVSDTANISSTTRFVVSRDKTLMAGVGGISGEQSLYIAVKGGGTFQQSDLTGNWKLHALTAGTTKRVWARGNAAFNSSGVITTSNAVNSQGTTTFDFPATPWTVPANGDFSGKNVAMSRDKNFMIMVVSNQDGSSSLALFVKTGSTGFSNSDLVGSWRSNWLAIGATSDMWVRSLAVIGSNGSLSSYGVIANGIGEPDNTSGDTIKLGPSGLVTTNTAENKLEGIMSIDKKLVIYTDLKGDKFRLGILMK